MLTAQAKLENWLAENNIMISVNQPQIRTLTDGAILLERPTVAVTYTHAKEVSDEQSTLQKKGGKKNG